MISLGVGDLVHLDLSMPPLICEQPSSINRKSTAETEASDALKKVNTKKIFPTQLPIVLENVTTLILMADGEGLLAAWY